MRSCWLLHSSAGVAHRASPLQFKVSIDFMNEISSNLKDNAQSFMFSQQEVAKIKIAAGTFYIGGCLPFCRKNSAENWRIIVVW